MHIYYIRMLMQLLISRVYNRREFIIQEFKLLLIYCTTNKYIKSLSAARGCTPRPHILDPLMMETYPLSKILGTPYCTFRVVMDRYITEHIEYRFIGLYLYWYNYCRCKIDHEVSPILSDLYRILELKCRTPRIS